MKTKFGLVFDVREDGTKVWAAECQGCGDLIVGERYPQVVVVKPKPDAFPMGQVRFVQLMRQATAAWDRARKTGHPIVIGEDLEIVSMHDHGDLQRALEAHEEKCPRRQVIAENVSRCVP